MQRRNLLKASLAGGLAAAAARPLLLSAADAVDGPETAQAMQELTAMIEGYEQAFASTAWNLRSAQDHAGARRALLHIVTHGLQTWLEADPARPFFVRWHTHQKKILGDNPDARYYATVISDQYRYRIRGNLAGATYTSFSQELGVGSIGKGLGATLNDKEIKTDADGNYEIIVSKKKVKGNWMPLSEGVESLTTRHYYERKESINNDYLHHIPLMIENLDKVDAPFIMTDAQMAAGIRRVIGFVKKTMMPPRTDIDIPFVSWVPNQFRPIESNKGNETISYAAKDNVYSMAPFALAPDQGLLIRGRFPKCRYASVMIYDRFLLTPDYRNNRVSLNRTQTRQEKNGEFEVLISAKESGHPNWIWNQGMHGGIVYWRFLLPEEPVQSLATEVVTL